MKQLALEVTGIQNQQVRGDFKYKNNRQTREEIRYMKNTIRGKATKLSPIVGELMIIPIKAEVSMVKQMLSGGKSSIEQTLIFKKINVPQNSNLSSKRNETIKLKSYNEKQELKEKDRSNFNTKQSDQCRATNIVQILKSKTIFTKEKQSLKVLQSESVKKLAKQNPNHSQSPNKLQSRVKTLPKIQPDKYSSERVRPLLQSFTQQLKDISSLHYYVIQHQQQVPIISFRSKSKIQVASLTKIMTFYTVYKVVLQFNVNIQQTFLKITEKMSGIPGTTANLEQNQIYSIEQLLYGMMLPSGNDAAIALSIWGGGYLNSSPSSDELSKMFVERMNFECKQLRMYNSTFGNPHGLPHKMNRTTCQDMARLCTECLNIRLFRQIVKTKVYKFKIYDGQLKRKIVLQWQNTNKLLQRPGFIGIKTGITVTAGPCLASAYEFLNKTYIVILAKCNKPSRRFKETRRLLAHCLQKIDHGRQLNKEELKTLKGLTKNNEQLDSDYSQDEIQFNFSTFTQEEIKRRARVITQL